MNGVTYLILMTMTLLFSSFLKQVDFVLCKNSLYTNSIILFEDYGENIYKPMEQ